MKTPMNAITMRTLTDIEEGVHPQQYLALLERRPSGVKQAAFEIGFECHGPAHAPSDGRSIINTRDRKSVV